MRPRHSWLSAGLIAAVALAVAIPVAGQDRPESILPPGFGEDPPAPPPPPADRRRPSDLLPDTAIVPPTSSPASPSSSSATASADDDDDEEGEDDEDDEELIVRYDIPASARRSTAAIGAIGVGDGDMGADAFNGSSGRTLQKLMRDLKGPIASRWAAIHLRRALLSNSRTPGDVEGPDWAAERAWLLVRMGEADSARMLVEAVDADLYTPKMQQVALQTALANADPALACNFAEPAAAKFKEPGWQAVRAICAGLSGESAFAGALLDRARATKRGAEIDYLLAEKVQGAAANTRRTVVIEWDGVGYLSAWRYGMASATGVPIPPTLLKTAQPHVRAWRARAPLVPFGDRAIDAEIAAAKGVLSSSALVDFYGAWLDSTDSPDRAGKPFNTLRDAYVGESESDRLAAMRTLWATEPGDPLRNYAQFVLTARAAANVVPSSETAGDAEQLLAAMLSAGLDTQAERWASVVEDSGSDGAWALLAVGALRAPGGISASRIEDVGDDAARNNARKAQLLFAGLAGLGRIAPNDLGEMAEQFAVPIGRRTKWNEALDFAVEQNAPATVALLCAIGLQAENWADIPPVQLYHIVSALRRVGHESEARMIAAEALARV